MKKHIPLLVLSMFLSVHIFASSITVNSQTQFNSALSAASANDTIVWVSGTYGDIYMNVSKSNVVIRAEEPGSVIFNGSSRASITGDYVTLSGFQYIGGDIGTSDVLKSYGKYNVFEHLNISGYTSYKYLVIDDEAQYNTVLFCNFENRVNYADKNILSILVDDTKPGYHVIQYCSFRDFIGDGSGSAGDDGVEPIRIGLSSQGNYISRTTVEYCYFTQCNGDGEIISNKARQNVFRYNTFDNNPESELVLRHGAEGVVYGNFFLNGMGGVRVREGQKHVIYNNYFSGLTSRSIYLQNDDSDPLADILIAYNTFVGTEEIRLGGSGSYDPVNTTIANNIFTQPTDALFSDATTTETWIGNIYNGTLGITEPASGLTSGDPELELNSKGYYMLASTSPAIDAAESGYPALPEYGGLDIDSDILLDIMRQSRPEAITSKDVGCSEYPENLVLKPMVDSTNTGPSYLWTGEVFTLNVNTVGNGAVTLNPAGGSYYEGTTVTITAVADASSTFSQWSGDASGSTNPETIVIDGDKSVTATFEELPTYTLDASAVGNGTITLNPAGGTYYQGTTVTITAAGDVGNTFSQWSGDVTGSTNPETIVIDGDKSVTATFEELPTYTLNASVVGNGTVTFNPSGGTYYEGTSVTITAVPDANNSFSLWSGDLSGSTNPETIVIDGNKSVTAAFEELNTYTIDVSITGNGTVTLDPSGGTYSEGTTVSLTAVPDANNFFSEWSGDITGSANPETIVVDGNKEVSATFEADGSSDLNAINNTNGIEVFPNPLQNVINLNFELNSSDLVEVNLLDISGRLVKSLLNENFSAGVHSFSFNIAEFSGGVYFLHIKKGSEPNTQIVRIIKQD